MAVMPVNIGECSPPTADVSDIDKTSIIRQPTLN